jgi:hypothetical protein
MYMYIHIHPYVIYKGFVQMTASEIIADKNYSTEITWCQHLLGSSQCSVLIKQSDSRCPLQF